VAFLFAVGASSMHDMIGRLLNKRISLLLQY
jgi:hypothetical protein